MFKSSSRFHWLFDPFPVGLYMCISLLCLSFWGNAQFSALDPSFGIGGYVEQDVNGLNDYFFAHAQQSSGKILAVGIGKTDSSYNHILLARYTVSGVLDSSFGTNGLFCEAIMPQSDEWALALKVLPDDKVVVAGKSDGGNKLLVVRFFPDGSIDSSFGSNGHFIFTNTTYNFFASDIGLQSDASIILTGFYQQQGVLASFVGKLTAQGSLDSSFGSNGWFISNTGNVYQDVQRLQIQPDNKIVFTASSNINSNGTDIVVTRLTANGQLDTSFNQSGIKVIDLCCGEYAYALQLQNDGKILIGGSGIDTPGLGRQFLLIRLLPDGRFDSSFHASGVVFTEVNNYASCIYSIGINPNGKIIVAGYNGDGVSNFNVALACYQANGQLDPTFNTSGIRTYSFALAQEYPECISIQLNGKMIVSGFNHDGNSMNGFVTRLKGEWPVMLNDPHPSELKVYPNPVYNQFHIQSPKDNRIKQMVVYNVYGKLVDIVNQVNLSGYTFNTNTWPPDLYVIAVTLFDETLVYSSVVKAR